MLFDFVMNLIDVPLESGRGVVDVVADVAAVANLLLEPVLAVPGLGGPRRHPHLFLLLLDPSHLSLEVGSLLGSYKMTNDK